MSDIVINNDHCALILSKEEAILVLALVGRMTYVTVGEAVNIYATICDSGFVSREESDAWWDKHVLKARIDLNFKGGDILPSGSLVITRAE